MVGFEVEGFSKSEKVMSSDGNDPEEPRGSVRVGGSTWLGNEKSEARMLLPVMLVAKGEIARPKSSTC
jgi:hypothetical protein